MARMSDKEQDKADREQKARKKIQRERRLKLLKSIVLNKSDKKALSRAKKSIGKDAKSAIGIKQEDYDNEGANIQGIVRSVDSVKRMEHNMKYDQVIKNEKNKNK